VPPTDDDGDDQGDEARYPSQGLRITHSQNGSRNDEEQDGDNETDHHPDEGLKSIRTSENEIDRSDHQK